MQRNILLALSVVIFALVAALSATNTQVIKLGVFGMNMDIMLGAIALTSYVLGIASAASLWAIRSVKEQKSEQTQIEWQKQDDKLAKEIQSDKEKQLLAKIDTLEAALKSALDKKKKTQV